MRKRAHFYIDHRNFHHRLEEIIQDGGRDYRWLDYCSLCRSLLRGPDEMLGEVNLFTAAPLPAVHGRQEAEFHCALVAALQSRGARVISGRFVHSGGKAKEKQTDVNLAVRMTEDALLGERADAHYLVSGDIDFAAAMRAVRKAGKTAGLVQPLLGRAQARSMMDLVRGASLDARGKPLVLNLHAGRLNGHSLPAVVSWRGRAIKMPAGCAVF